MCYLLLFSFLHTLPLYYLLGMHKSLKAIVSSKIPSFFIHVYPAISLFEFPGVPCINIRRREREQGFQGTKCSAH